jgi:hypothetical protein
MHDVTTVEQRITSDGFAEEVAITEYADIARVPELAGGVHEMVAVDVVAVTYEMVGTPGVLGVVSDAVAASEAPIEFEAVTDTDKGAPGVSEEIMHDVARADA